MAKIRLKKEQKKYDRERLMKRRIKERKKVFLVYFLLTANVTAPVCGFAVEAKLRPVDFLMVSTHFHTISGKAVFKKMCGVLALPLEFSAFN